jgi:hypothetical protein
VFLHPICIRIIEVKLGSADISIRQSEISPQIKNGNSISRGKVAESFGLKSGVPLKEQGYPNGISIEIMNFPWCQIMKEKDIVSILKEQGWVFNKDEVGDYFCLADVGEVQLQVIPSVGKRSDHFRVSLMPSISSREFSEAVSFILGDDSSNAPIIVSNGAPEKFSSFSSDDIIRLSDKAISWARSQNIDEGLRVYRALPTDVKGAMPIRHLAALAMAGDTGRLDEYKKSFEMGDRMGFVPYVTSEMIDRALMVAQKSK